MYASQEIQAKCKVDASISKNEKNTPIINNS